MKYDDESKAIKLTIVYGSMYIVPLCLYGYFWLLGWLIFKGVKLLFDGILLACWMCLVIGRSCSTRSDNILTVVPTKSLINSLVKSISFEWLMASIASAFSECQWDSVSCNSALVQIPALSLTAYFLSSLHPAIRNYFPFNPSTSCTHDCPASNHHVDTTIVLFR